MLTKSLHSMFCIYKGDPQFVHTSSLRSPDCIAGSWKQNSCLLYKTYCNITADFTRPLNPIEIKGFLHSKVG